MRVQRGFYHPLALILFSSNVLAGFSKYALYNYQSFGHFI